MDLWKDASPDSLPADPGPLPGSPAAEVEALRALVRSRGIDPDLTPREASRYQAEILSPLWAACARYRTA